MVFRLLLQPLPPPLLWLILLLQQQQLLLLLLLLLLMLLMLLLRAPRAAPGVQPRRGRKGRHGRRLRPLRLPQWLWHALWSLPSLLILALPRSLTGGRVGLPCCCCCCCCELGSVGVGRVPVGLGAWVSVVLQLRRPQRRPCSSVPC